MAVESISCATRGGFRKIYRGILIYTVEEREVTYNIKREETAVTGNSPSQRLLATQPHATDNSPFGVERVNQTIDKQHRETFLI